MDLLGSTVQRKLKNVRNPIRAWEQSAWPQGCHEGKVGLYYSWTPVVTSPTLREDPVFQPVLGPLGQSQDLERNLARLPTPSHEYT